MKIKETMVFSNNGYISGSTTYSLALYNPIENKTYTFTDTENVTSDRYLTMTIDPSSLNKGTYKGTLTVNGNTFYEFVAQKDLESETKYTNDVAKEKYTYEK